MLLAPAADGEDIGQVPAQPVQLGDGARVAWPDVAGEAAEARTVQRILKEVAALLKIRTPAGRCGPVARELTEEARLVVTPTDPRVEIIDRQKFWSRGNVCCGRERK